MPRQRLEDKSLEEYFKWLKSKKWDTNFYHMPNELPANDKSMMIYAMNLKRKGKKAGYADGQILEQHNGYGALFIEFKTKTGSPTFEQLVFLHNTTNNGYLSCIAHSLEEAKKITTWYMENQKTEPPLSLKEFKRKGIPFIVKVVD